MSLAVARVLEDALDVINERGWCQRVLEDDAGRVCAVGAVNYAVGPSCSFMYSASHLGLANLRHAAFCALAAAAQLERSSIVDYNNAHGRSIEDIKLWFKQAAETERAE